MLAFDLVHLVVDAEIVMLLDCPVPVRPGLAVQRTVREGMHVLNTAPVADVEDLGMGLSVLVRPLALAEDCVFRRRGSALLCPSDICLRGARDPGGLTAILRRTLAQ